MRFDTLIVGCGAAGGVLAARLSENPGRSIGVIEAGADYPSIDALPIGVRTHRSLRGLAVSATRQANDPDLVGFPDWGLTARSTDLQPTAPLPRGKVIGGSSSVNGAVFFRALRTDLDEWAAAGNSDWSFERCLPFFNKLESDCDFVAPYHGDGGPIPVHRAQPTDWVPLNRAFHAACRALGYPDCPDFNRPDVSGVGAIPVNVHEHVRFSSAVGYLLPAHSRPNLTVVANAQALRVTLDAGRATGVVIVQDGVIDTIEAGEVILSAGAIGSPQLLMLSGVGPAAQLESVGVDVRVDLPGVGQNLRDHPVLCASWGTTQAELPTSGPGMPGQVGLRATTPGSMDPDDMRLISFRAEGPDRFGIPFSLMHALSAGSLTLADGDPLTSPRIDFKHLDHPADRARMRDILQVVMTVAEHPAYDGLRRDRLQPAAAELHSETTLDDWMLANLITGHHISSTCKMGPASDQEAVVDQTGAVYGTRRLHVIDASILPDCPRVNINATTMMVAEKLAARRVD